MCYCQFQNDIWLFRQYIYIYIYIYTIGSSLLSFLLYTTSRSKQHILLLRFSIPTCQSTFCLWSLDIKWSYMSFPVFLPSSSILISLLLSLSIYIYIYIYISSTRCANCTYSFDTLSLPLAIHPYWPPFLISFLDGTQCLHRVDEYKFFCSSANIGMSM